MCLFPVTFAAKAIDKKVEGYKPLNEMNGKAQTELWVFRDQRSQGISDIV